MQLTKPISSIARRKLDYRRALTYSCDSSMSQNGPCGRAQCSLLQSDLAPSFHFYSNLMTFMLGVKLLRQSRSVPGRSLSDVWA